MSTLPSVELGVLGPLQVRQDGAPVNIPGAKPRAILTMLGLHNGSVVSADTLIELLWGDDPPRTAAKALQTHISSLRRTLGDGFVLTEGAGWIVAAAEVDATRYKLAARTGRDAAGAGDTSQAVARFEQALVLWRGVPELPDGRRGLSEKTRWIEGHAALVEDRADALLATGRAAEVIGDLEAAVAEAPLRERRWGQLMLALYRAGRQGEALGAYQRARTLLADELGVDPGPELRRLEAAVVAQDASLDIPVAQNILAVTRAVTFLLTDIEGSTAAWEADADAMAAALARHDELIEQVVTSRGGRLIKTRGEGDATFSVFERPSAAAAAAIEMQDAIGHEPWALREPLRIRVALHTGEVELRDGDYFGRAVNRAARLRSLAEGGQILCSGATAELVIDSLPDDVELTDLGMRQLKNLARPEHVFELRLQTAEDGPQPQTSDVPMQRPGFPPVLSGPGPFVGRSDELERLLSAWQAALAGGARTVLIAGEPGVGKTRLAGEWSQRAYEQGAVVLYGRCDEDLGAPYQPFAEALRSLVPCMGASRLRGLRGVEALLPLVPGLPDVLPDLATPARADPDTERYALFDAVVALLEIASIGAPIVLILDDLHWAAKPTLLLLRHLLRFGERARVQIVGTYRSTDLDRSHPLAAMLADLHRDGTANRLSLSGLDQDDVTAYVAEAGYDDEELAHALASVTGGNPFFLIEALRHVEESGGVWDQSTLPQGVREAVSRRLSRLPGETNKALAAAAVVGSRFALELVEHVVGSDLVDAFDEACQAGIVIEEAGGHYRFNHAIVRQSLLAELASVRRMRLHQRIAATLETQPGADDELLAELAHHYFECAWAGNAAKAVFYCRRAADQAMARLAYEGAADLYDHALHALEDLDEELPDRDDQVADLLIARCEALLAGGDVTSAASAVSQLQEATVDSARLTAWATCFDGQLSVLIHPERLDEVEVALGAAAEKLAGLDDAAGEAMAHTVRATCLGRLGRIAECEVALDDALTAARRAREYRRVNAVLAGAPLAALWGPNPVPRAGGRCLDVVRLLRITTDSPAVEATSTRCQAVLEAFRGRASAARRMIDSARRTVTELGLRHARLEVEQFAGIVELVADDPAAAEPHLRRAYNGFRRMRLDADTAETAALLGRTCLALEREDEADELCSESERLAGHALKASIAWRTLRAKLLSRGGDHAEARRVAEAAVNLAGRTDALVDHGDACLALATVLGAASDATGARSAAERAVDLYERKGAAALADKARRILGERTAPPTPPEAPRVELTNACVLVADQLVSAVNREAWDEVEQLFAPSVSVESRRKIVGFPRLDLPSRQWPHEMRRYLATGMVRHRHAAVAVRGERLALVRVQAGTADPSSGAPQDEMLQVIGLDTEGRITLQVWFDVEDIDAALAELDAVHARFEEEQQRPRRLENAASQAVEQYLAQFAARDWDALAKVMADDIVTDDRRRAVNAGIRHGRDAEVANLRATADAGFTYITSVVIATRGKRLILARASGRDNGSEEFVNDVLGVVEINSDNQIAAIVVFDHDDFEAAIAELDARYLAGEAAAHARTWSAISRTYATFNRRELPPTTPDWVNVDHRRGRSFASGDTNAYLRATWDLAPDINIYIEAVERLSDIGGVITHAAHGTSRGGFDAEWRETTVLTVDGELVNRSEVFDEADLETIARFEQLSQPAPRLENAASRVNERLWQYFDARDWDAIAEVLADDVIADDRRRAANAGIHHGRDVWIEDLQAAADVGFTKLTSEVIATRGERLILTRLRASGCDPEAIQIEVLHIVELNADDRIVASVVVFDIDDFDTAIEELDTRYLAGEAAAYSHSWSVITRGYAAFNRHEFPAPNWVNIDHRRARAFAPGELTAYMHATWDLAPNVRVYVEAVHRLSHLGAVATHVVRGTSREGFDAEWREVILFTIEGDVFNRCEVFDEADVDAALARFEELHPQTGRLENAVAERFVAHFAARDWDAMAHLFADDYYCDDRRRVVNAGVRHGRDAAIEDLRVAVDVGLLSDSTSDIIATRGEHLILTRFRASGPDHEAIQLDVLQVIEYDADERITAAVVFDPDDIDAAFEELDARYLAGEAAAHSHTWSVITRGCAALNRREPLPTTPDWVNIDHRRGIAFTPGDLTAYIRTAWDLLSEGGIYIETAHRLSNFGGVFTWAAHGTSQEGVDVEFRGINMLTVEGDLINRIEIFDETDLDTAIERFEQLSGSVRQLENATSRIYGRLWKSFAARDWDAMAQLFADDYYHDDRRRVVNAGVRHGRDAAIEDLRIAVDVGLSINITSKTIATRGERLILTRFHTSGREHEAIQQDGFLVVERGADDRIAAAVMFDTNDIDAAFEELDARYLAGEAAAHAHTWSVVMGAYAALNRRELPQTTSDWVNIDRRRLVKIESGGMEEYLRATFDATRDVSLHVKAVHRLSDFGVVVTHQSHATSQEGLDAEWQDINLLMVEGDLVNRCELFDETDLNAAIERFEQLSRSARRLENAASHRGERYLALVAAGDWDAMAEILADNFSTDDRRRVVGAGLRSGRDAQIADMRTIAGLSSMNMTSTVTAIRGERLALLRADFSGRNSESEAFLTQVLVIVEIKADERIVATVSFDLDDFETAVKELDARYMAGEAAAYAHTWSVITEGFAATNRHELTPTTPDCVSIDHRRGAAYGPGELIEYVRAGWELGQNIRTYVEVVHRLNDLGVVCTHAAQGISREGFDAEWRGVDLLMLDGDIVNRCELFDEADLDVAIARFEQLSRAAPRLENAASQVGQRFLERLAASDWDATAKMLVDNFSQDDRRRVVGAGARHGRDAQIADMRAIADLSITNLTATVMATRGKRLALMRVCFSFRDQGAEAFLTEPLGIVEIDADERIVAVVAFDANDIDTAFEELDARYLAGEAAAHSQTWSVVSGAYAAMNRRELFATTPDWANIDHRRPAIIEEGGLNASLRSLWKLMPDLNFRIEAVHRLSNLGAVCTHVAHGVSQDGFDAEWRGVELLTVDGHLIDRCEIFDEVDLDAALAHFEELHPQAPRLENAASRLAERFLEQFAARDWDAMAEVLADDYSSDDRRRVVGAGVRHGRDDEIASMRAVAEAAANITLAVIATRGGRLALTRMLSSNSDLRYGEFGIEMLGIAEIDADDRIAAHILFDPDDVDAAIAELDARYLAGEAAAFSQTWSVIAETFSALNRHELPPTTPDRVNVDRRRVTTTAAGDLIPSLGVTWDLMPDFAIHIETVHRLTDFGAAFTYMARGTSQHGVDAEWCEIAILSIEGDLINRCELFDESDIDAALARFEELRPRSRLENAASRADDRFFAYFRARNWAAIAEILTDDSFIDDRHDVVTSAGFWDGRDAVIANLQALAEAAPMTWAVIATRGERLALTRICSPNRDQRQGEFSIEMLIIAEVDTDGRLTAQISFDVNDVDAAFAELDARYLATEAAAHSHTWTAVTQVQAAYNRHESAPTTEDWENIDHRRGRAFAPGDMIPYILATYDVAPNVKGHIEAVHRLSNLGAVVTEVVTGTSQEGFAFEWREIALFAFEGELLCRFEMFDEADLDTALARFDELQPQARRLENAASQLGERIVAHFTARDWTALTELLADDHYTDDRRRVVNAGNQHGRDLDIATLRAIADLGVANIALTIVATRGQRLALTRARMMGRDQRPEAFHTEALNILEIDVDNRAVAQVVFDPDAIDDVFEELDARYLAGEAAAHAHTWSAIASECAAFNRHELTAADYVTIDHRQLAIIDAADPQAATRATWDVTPNFSIHIEAVHRLSSLGALATYAAYGTSPEGFDAEWRMILLLTVEGDRINRCEVFDEADLDAALARFDELQPQARRLENAASQMIKRYQASFAARDWAAMAELLADDIVMDDRRHVVNAGVRRGRDVNLADNQAAVEVGAESITSSIIATRGERLALARVRSRNRGLLPDEFDAEMLGIAEINADNRIAATFAFDLDDIDAAFEELDARYQAGEAAAHGQTWSLIASRYAALNRHELPLDSINIDDHRRIGMVEPGDPTALLRAGWDLTPNFSIHIEAVHQLSGLGAVVTRATNASSQDGFAAEWRAIDLWTVEGDRVTGCELFDETDLDSALAAFDELERPGAST